jgi:cbb3-type cytochrome oxidase maturation protein
MEIITLLIFISLLIAVGFLIVFLWNMKSGQYDDTFSPSVRMLFDDKPKVFKENDTPIAEKLEHKRAEIAQADDETNNGKSVL